MVRRNRKPKSDDVTKRELNTLLRRMENSLDNDSTKGKEKATTVSKGIQRIENRLKELSVTYTKETRFSLCRDKRELPFDIIIIVNGRAGVIEYDGKQHFFIVPKFHTSNEETAKTRLQTQQTHDIIKNKFTKTNGISLLRISYEEDGDGKIEEWVTKYIEAMKVATGRVEMFSNATLYKNPYGVSESPGEGCIMM